MKETSQQLSSASRRCCGPPGSLTDTRLAEAPNCKEPEENKEMEKDGVLTAEVVSSCISHLGRIGTGLQYLYHHLSLPSRNLRDVSILSSYVHLQKLELPHNKIKDNRFSEISGLEHCCRLTHLSLAHNKISKISGLDKLPLTDLCLVGPPVSRTALSASLFPSPSQHRPGASRDHCSHPPPLTAALCQATCLARAGRGAARQLDNNFSQWNERGNQLVRIEGLENLKSLQGLDLSLNRITSLSGLQNLHLLGSINLEKNLINEIQECKHIHGLSLLRDLNLLGNHVQEQPDYRLSVVFLLQHLMVLDQEKVTVEEKVSSVNKYDPPLDVVAARDHMTHLVYQLMQPQVLYYSTLPSADCPYPMLVLTGPQGCGKRELAHRLCQEFSEYFAHGTCHTTRGPYLGEENGSDYHFVSEEDFQNIIHMGKFIQTMQYGGHSYGLTRDSIEDVAREGLACCVHMELEGVLSLKNSYFEPRYILFIPTQLDKYIGHLKSRDLYTPAQIDMAMSRTELYANFNRQRPGFFDNVIPCDDWEEAYQMLEQVVKDYLLLEEQGEGENNTSTVSGHGPEEKPPSDLSRSGSDTMSHSATALDPSVPSYRNYSAKIQAQLSPQKSPAELASIRRREQLVREAIVGRSPGVYSHLFKSSAQTAPSSRQNHDPGAHFSEDSSSDESHVSSVLSVPSSAGALSGLVEPLDMSVLGQTLETLKDHMTSDQTPDAAHPGTDQPAAVMTPSSERRPGSNVKPILPPIPTGRKTPAAPSPSQQKEKKDEEANREG
ncbi:hypothetical protein PAMP_015055 [Pampus punctatissimus]